MKLRWVFLAVLVVLLVVPAVAISVGRLLDLPGGIWVRLVFFTQYATVLYTAAFLLLLLAWARGRGAWRGIARALALVCLAGAVVHAVLAAPAYVGGAPEPTPGRERLRMMTLNLLFGQARPARVVDLAVANQVDVLVTQEIDATALQGLRSAGLEEAFPHVAGEPGSGPVGTMVFSRLPVSDVAAIDTEFGGYRLLVDEEVTLFAVHTRAPTEQSARWRADMQAVTRAASLADGPVVVAGDFNATTDHRELRDLIGRGFEDAATVANSRWQPTFPDASEITALGVPVPPLWAIDHVLVNDALRVLDTDTTSVDGTDHRALIAILER